MSNWTKEREQEIRNRCEKATAAPWICEDMPHCHAEECFVVVTSEKGLRGGELFDTGNRGYKESLVSNEDSHKWHDIRGIADLEFAAHARTDLPDALDELDRRVAQIAELEQAVRTLRDALGHSIICPMPDCAMCIEIKAALETTKDLA